MKKNYLCFALAFITLVYSHSQGLYFDAGLDVGVDETGISGAEDELGDTLSPPVSTLGFNVGFKIGYGPIGEIPLFIVGEVSSCNLFKKSCEIGAGIIFYPISRFQLSGSYGYSILLTPTYYEGDGGLTWNIALALDSRSDRNGLLIGLKYSYLQYELVYPGAVKSSSLLSLFVKYAYRNKIK